MDRLYQWYLNVLRGFPSHAQESTKQCIAFSGDYIVYVLYVV